MTVSKERKAELTAEFGKNAQDTGNPKVQVAIATERIRELTEHMKTHPSSTVNSSRSSASATTSSKLCMREPLRGLLFM